MAANPSSQTSPESQEIPWSRKASQSAINVSPMMNLGSTLTKTSVARGVGRLSTNEDTSEIGAGLAKSRRISARARKASASPISRSPYSETRTCLPSVAKDNPQIVSSRKHTSETAARTTQGRSRFNWRASVPTRKNAPAAPIEFGPLAAM